MLYMKDEKELFKLTEVSRLSNLVVMSANLRERNYGCFMGKEDFSHKCIKSAEVSYTMSASMYT